MNKTEARYAARLDAEIAAGIVHRYWFESVNFRLAHVKAYYKPDFLVQLPTGALEIHEVKGSSRIENESLLRLKVVADRFPFRVLVVWPSREAWNFREIC
jgi:hypothetical protein